MAWTIVYTFEDFKGAESTTEINVPETVAYDDVQSFATDMGNIIKSLILGEMTGATITVPANIGIRVAALAEADVEEGARFQFETTGGFNTSMRIPTFNEDKIIAGTREVDQADLDVAAYVAGMLSGITVISGNLVEPSDKRGETLQRVSQAREQFLASRRSR